MAIHVIDGIIDAAKTASAIKDAFTVEQFSGSL